ASHLRQRLELRGVHLRLFARRGGLAVVQLQGDDHLPALPLLGLEHHGGTFLETLETFLEVLALRTQHLRLFREADLLRLLATSETRPHVVGVALLDLRLADVAARVARAASTAHPRARQDLLAVLFHGLEHHQGALFQGRVLDSLVTLLVRDDDPGFFGDDKLQVLAPCSDGDRPPVGVHLLDLAALNLLLGWEACREEDEPEHPTAQGSQHDFSLWYISRAMNGTEAQYRPEPPALQQRFGLCHRVRPLVYSDRPQAKRQPASR